MRFRVSKEGKEQKQNEHDKMMMIGVTWGSNLIKHRWNICKNMWNRRNNKFHDDPVTLQIRTTFLDDFLTSEHQRGLDSLPSHFEVYFSSTLATLLTSPLHKRM